MKLGILSDIHGNLNALMAVLDHCKSEKIEKLIVLGDQMGYYYDVPQVYIELNKWQSIILRGNHEDIFLEYQMMNTEEKHKIHSKYGSSFSFLTSPDLIRTINALKRSHTLRLGNDRVLFIHDNTRADYNLYLYPDTDNKILESELEKEFDYVFVGHSHYSFHFQKEGRHLVNVGSVGQNRKQGGVAEWCIFNTVEKSIFMMKTPYDQKNIVEKIDKYDPNIPYLKAVLNR